MRMQTSNTARKVKGSTTGGGIGGALAIILIYAVQEFGIDAPAHVQAAVAVLVTAAVTAVGSWIGGYYTKPSHTDKVVAE